MVALFWPLLVIPIANIAVLLLAKAGISRRTFSVLSAMNGVACAVSILLAIVLSPLCALACIGMIVGIAVPQLFLFCLYHLLVALGPVITALTMRRRLLRLNSDKRMPWIPMGTAAALTLSIALLAVFPTLLTHRCLLAADNDKMQNQAILLLRAFGDNETMLRSCYSQQLALPWWFIFAQGMATDYSTETDPKRLTARENFYRATGLPFNSMKRPSGTHTYYDWDDEIAWWNDHDFAGATVGGIVPGLTLAKSNIDGWVDSDECVSHMSWRMNFKRDTSSRAELRAELMLPPQAVVTGCSLMIDGVKRDAIIGTRSSTRRAYVSSAQNGERPFMISTAGAGRVLIQSSTGWWGKDVDLKVELTSPTTVLKNDSAALRLPVFTERNFGVTASHVVNLNVTTSGVSQTIRKELSDKSIHLAEGTISLHRDPNFLKVRATVPYFSQGTELIEELKATTFDKKVPLKIVIDGSACMAPSIDSVCKSLSDIDFPDATLVWASDTPQSLVSHVSTKSQEWRESVEKLRDAGCVGGQDNARALLMAVKNETTGNNDANIAWIHGPQPAKLSGDKLVPALASSKSKLFEYQISAAPNELIRTLDHSPNLIQVPILNNTEADLKELFARLSGSQPYMAMQGSIETADAAQAPVSKHPDELAQVFVNQMILNKLGTASEQELGVMAQNASIVTPLTSALVLETQQAYDKYDVKQYGKNQANASKNGTNQSNLAKALPFAGGLIPTNPEPPMGLLVASAMLILAGLKWLQRKFKHA